MATKNYVLALTYDASGIKLVDQDLSGYRSFDNDAAKLYDDGKSAILPGDNKILLVSDSHQLHMFDLDGGFLWTANPDINRFDFDYRMSFKGAVAGHFFLQMLKGTDVVGSPDYVFPVPTDFTKLVFEKRSLTDGSLVSTAELHSDLYDAVNFVNYVEGDFFGPVVSRGNFVYYKTGVSTPTIGKQIIKVDMRDGTYSVIATLAAGMTSITSQLFLEERSLTNPDSKKMLVFSKQTDGVDIKDVISIIDPTDDSVVTHAFLELATDAGYLNGLEDAPVFLDFAGGKIVFVDGNATNSIVFSTGVKGTAVPFAAPYDTYSVATLKSKTCFIDSGTKVFAPVRNVHFVVFDVATGAVVDGPVPLPWGAQGNIDGLGRFDGNDINLIYSVEGLQTYSLSGTVSVSAAAAVKRVELHDQATGYKITAKNSEANGTIAFECLSPRKKSAVCESPNSTTEFQVRNELVPTATA